MPVAISLDDVRSLWDEIVTDGPTARGQGPGGPNPVKAPRQRRKGKTPHKRLLEACRQALRLQYPRAMLEVRNVAVLQIQDHRGPRMARFGQTGEADLRFFQDGVAVALEIKAPETGDKQSDAQIRWAERFTRAGGVYGVVHSADDALQLVRGAFRLRPQGG